jgi:hypothetical protein
MEDIVKGFTKITAALAAFVLLFVAIGVSSTGSVAAQSAAISITPLSASALGATDTRKNDTICSNLGAVGAKCATAGDNTFVIRVVDGGVGAGGANVSVDIQDRVLVTLKNGDLATVTPATAADSNAKTISLIEVTDASSTTATLVGAINTGIFARVVTSKHASTGLKGNLGAGQLATTALPLIGGTAIVTTASATSITSLDWDTNAANGLAGPALTAAEQTALVGATMCISWTSDQAAPEGECRPITARTADGVFTVDPAFSVVTTATDKAIILPKVEAKAFTGNTITGTYKPSGTLGISKSITVDNQKPVLLVSSPAVDLITKSAKTIVFNADVTDTGAGFGSKSSSVTAANAAAADAALTVPTMKGRVELFVGKKASGVGAVTLPSSAYTAITNGWNINASFNSTDIANIAPRVPWWIEAEDLAGNAVMPASGYKGNTTGTADNVSLIDSSLIGMGDDMLNGHSASIYCSGVKSTKAISDFDSATGDMTTAAFGCVPATNQEYELVGVGLITVDSTAPAVASSSAVVTGHNWSATKAAGSRLRTEAALADKDTSIRVTFTDASGLEASTVSPASFTVTGHTVTSTLLVDVVGENASSPVQRMPNDVFLTLGSAMTSSERPNVTINGGIITDKAGNAVVSATFKATDKQGPGLTHSKSASLSKSSVTVTVTADEQLLANPTTTLWRSDSATNSKSVNSVTMTTTTQTGALTYTYKVPIASIEPDANEPGQEFMVYTIADDTSSNTGKVGNATDFAAVTALTFELDRKLNGGMNPKVSVSDKVATCTSGLYLADADGDACVSAAGPNVEAVDPMIVTVDFNTQCVTAACSGTAGSNLLGESKEYPRDSYKTVTLQKASLKITIADGSYTTTAIDLAVGVSSPDNKRFTIPVASPVVGKYELTIQAVDAAGNDNLNATTATSAQSLKYAWSVTAAQPVKLALSPGWNLISLPFQPASPAINSIISATHPADIVMTFDNANQVWLVSRRDAVSGLFTGDVNVMTANTAYFVRTNNFQEISLLRPPVATAAAAPPPPPVISVVAGWNLVPVVSLTIPLPKGVAADSYFGTLAAGTNTGWLKAMTFSPLTRTWTSVTPRQKATYVVGAINPCTGVALNATNVANQTEPCQSGAYTIVDATAGFQGADTVALKTAVLTGKGYWLYASSAGVIIP